MISDRAVTWIRAGVVALYAVIAGGMAGGGITAAEFGLLLVLGVIALVAVLVADWINHGVRRDGE